jgi:deoxyhypusine synthase
MEPVKDLSLTNNVKDLIEQFSKSGGFTSRSLAEGVSILKTMKQENCLKFLSFPACIIATGTRGVIKDLVKNKLVDVIVTTCGTLDHDYARVFKDYYCGSFDLNDHELHEKRINRLGSVLIPNECYGEVLEDNLQPLFKKLHEEKKEYSSKELAWALGKSLENNPKREESILYWAWKNQIPVFVPGITDGAVGSQIWLFSQLHSDFKIDVLKDQQEIFELINSAEKTGALIVGGGISKHHTIWWAQFKGGFDYTVYVTTSSEYDGSLSGARTREAISWGKISEKAKHVTIQGDATIILPLLISALS